MNPTVAVVTPTLAGPERLGAWIQAVSRVRSQRTKVADVVVVQDGEGPRTAAWLARNAGWARCLSFRENQGFGAAANAAVLAARAEIVVLLNDDALPEPDFLAPLAAHFRDPQVFAVSCRQTPGGGLSRGVFHMGLLRLRWRDAWDGPPVPTLFADGGAAAFRRETFLALGGFERLYRPFYGEDLDLSYRAWKRGWRVVHEPRSVVRHERGATIAARFASTNVRAASLKNRLLFVWRNVTDPAFVAAHRAALPLRVVRALATADRTWLAALRMAARQRAEARALAVRDRAVWTRTDREVLALSSSWAAS